jgi:diguanylate cyclase (GGDEF)-like protein
VINIAPARPTVLGKEPVLCSGWKRVRMRRRAAVVTTFVLAAALGALMALVLAAIGGMSARTTAVGMSVRALSAFQDVQRALAAEAFAEAGYRRSPSTPSRARVEREILALGRSVAAVRALDSRRDDGTVNYLLNLNSRYEAEVRLALRDGSRAAATSVDDRVAGPALDAMQELVDAAVSRRQRLVDTALKEQAGLNRKLWILGPTVLLVSVLAIGLCWAVILAQHRRLHGRVADSEHKAMHDPLTGVGNRALLSLQLGVELGKARPNAGLVMVDLDHFKQVNDRHGHVAGDQVLRVVASRLLRVSRTLDVVCRMGGDEFAILVRPASRVPEVLADIRQVLAEAVEHEGLLLGAGGSAGSADVQAGMDEREVLTVADEALYAAKREGRIPVPRDPAVRAVP